MLVRKKFKAKVAAGLAKPKEKKEPKEKVIIPPDPAVILGQRSPGECAFPEKHHHPPSRGNSVPLANANGKPLRSSTERQGPPPPAASVDQPESESEKISEEMTVPRIV